MKKAQWHARTEPTRRGVGCAGLTLSSAERAVSKSAKSSIESEPLRPDEPARVRRRDARAHARFGWTIALPQKKGLRDSIARFGDHET